MVGDWLARREMLTPDKVALIDAEHSYRPVTYREWNRAANRTANWLASMGVGKGDLVAVLAMNCVEYLDIWFACGKLGAIMQTLNWRLIPTEVAALLAHATPLVLIYGPEFIGHVDEIERGQPGIKHFVSLAADTHGDNHLSIGERNNCPDAPPDPVIL